MEQKKQFIKEYLEIYGKKLESKYLEQITQSQLTNQPMFLRILLDHLKNIATFDNLGEIITKLLKSSSIQQLFEFILSDWEKIYPVDLIKSSLTSLYYSKSGLSEVELKILSVTSNSNSNSSSSWNSYFSALSKFLTPSSDRIYSIFHSCFRNVCIFLFSIFFNLIIIIFLYF